MDTTARADPALADVSDAQWDALSRREIFFAHQSVGENILEGIADVMASNPKVRLHVVQSHQFSASDAPAFHHAFIGRNDHPIEKLDDFVNVVSAGFDQRGGVAMLKFCFVDFHGDTDAEALFREYQQRIAALRARNPSLTIVHFTAPLTSIENWKGRLRAFVTRTPSQRDRNVVRSEYSALVRRAYLGREPVFDIARLESTLPDGRHAFFRASGRDVPLLAPAYTDDGGHLNASARRRVAEQLLIMLARLQPDSAAHTARSTVAQTTRRTATH